MLSGFRLTLRRLRDGRLALTVPPWFRLLLLGFGLLILYALAATEPSGFRGLFVSANIAPLLFCALSLLGAAYSERWSFDRGAGSCVHEVGLLGLGRRRAWALAEIEAVEVGQFIRGRPHAPANLRPGLFVRPVVTLSLRCASGEQLRLDSYAASQRARVQQYALAIASHCGIRLSADGEDSAEQPEPPRR